MARNQWTRREFLVATGAAGLGELAADSQVVAAGTRYH
jgi:hypothetical protein